jgi:hypothetical protein
MVSHERNVKLRNPDSEVTTIRISLFGICRSLLPMWILYIMFENGVK